MFKVKKAKKTTLGLDHFLGNPLFAIETNLNPLRKRIKDGRYNEALEIIDSIQRSVNKAKEALKSCGY